MVSQAEFCPCGKLDENKNRLTYKSCCEIAHLNHAGVLSVEQLMRSRYTAFTMALGDYLMATHHPSTRPIKEKEDIVKWAKSVTWSHLIVNHVSDNKATVKFEAYFYEQSKKLSCIHENSQFVNENGLWYYLGFAE